MSKRRDILSASAFLLAAGVPPAPCAAQARDVRKGRRELLRDWQYPDSHIDGATGADGPGNDQFTATMRTPDGVDEVVKFYEQQTGHSLTPKHPGFGYSNNLGDVHVFFDDASARRPFTLRIFTRATKTSSMTIVISRGAEEKLTFISWSYAEL